MPLNTFLTRWLVMSPLKTATTPAVQFAGTGGVGVPGQYLLVGFKAVFGRPDLRGLIYLIWNGSKSCIPDDGAAQGDIAGRIVFRKMRPQQPSPSGREPNV